MKYYMLAAIALFFSITGFSQNAGDKIIGNYYTPAKDGKVMIYRKGNAYFGKVVTATQSLKDVNNPNPALRTRNLIGSDFLTNFKYDGEEYVDGNIYDPTSGKTYSGKMWLEGNDLKVRGFVGFSMLGRTETFKRIN